MLEVVLSLSSEYSRNGLIRYNLSALGLFGKINSYMSITDYNLLTNLFAE
jgi:hypothetical protein